MRLDLWGNVLQEPEEWNTDKWGTPWPLVRSLEDEFGKFDLDPCCEERTAKATTFYTIDDDGLTRRWFGRVFVNPPYSNIRPWCARAVMIMKEGKADLVVMLLPSATDTRWFHDFVLPYAELRFIRGRIQFIGKEGTEPSDATSPNLLAIYKGR